MENKDIKNTGTAEKISERPGNVDLGFLLDFYGELLTDRQRELADYYYNDDLSLSEIAEITGISRQGVRAALEKSRGILLRFEEKLGLAARFSAARAESDIIAEGLKRLSEGDDSEIASLMTAVERLQKLYE